MSRVTGVWVVSLCVALLALAPNPAAAALPTTFAAEGEGAGQLESPRGIAIDQESGGVFITDTANNRAMGFGEEGNFILGFGFGVSDGQSQEPQVCEVHCVKGLAGAGPGQFGELPTGVAIDQSLGLGHGDVYVLDQRNNRVEKYAPNGEFLLMFGGEVNATSKGNLCLSGETCKAGVKGSAPGRFEGLFGRAIAVDASGTVYVGDRNRIQKFSPGGVLEGQITLAAIGAVEELAVDQAKALYERSSSISGVRKYDQTGTQLGSTRDATGQAQAIALDTAGELFVVDGSGGVQHILKYDGEGDQLSSFDAGGKGGANGLAFSEKAEALYLLGNGTVTIVTPPPPGPLVLEESEVASELQPTSARLNARVNPEGPGVTTYHFEYGPTTAYGTSTATETLGGGTFEDQSASALVTGLSPASKYHFRTVVTNSISGTTFGPDQTFTTGPAVSIDDESASQVSASSALLETELNAHGSETHFRFEYGPTTAYGQSAPVPDANAGSSASDRSFQLLIEGLSPNSTYHYRVIAHNSLGESKGEDQSFRTQGSEAASGLLDGRQWEMVSPAQKQGVALDPLLREGAAIQAAASGEGLAYAAKAPINDEPAGSRSVAEQELLAKRGPSGGWETKDIATAHREVSGIVPGFISEYKLFSEDLNMGFVEPEGSTPLSSAAAEANEATPYRREVNGEYTPLLTRANVAPGVEFGGIENEPGHFAEGGEFVTATPDGAHAILQSVKALTPGFESGGRYSLYEWSEGQLELVSIPPSGVPAAVEGQLALLGQGSLNVRGALSADGRRVFFEASKGASRHLYARDLALRQTAQLDAVQPGAKGGEGIPIFQLASADGQKVLFTDAARLTRDATAKEGKPDLYLCTLRLNGGVLGCKLQDLSVDRFAGEAANVRGTVIGADQSARYVYFVANGALAQGAVHGGCQGNTHQLPGVFCNLYVADTTAGSVSLVAVMANSDSADWGDSGTPPGDLGGLTARVSPNGHYLALMSSEPLTGFDNRDAKSGQPDVEVFEYDHTTNQIACVSCEASGARPEGVHDQGNLVVDKPRIWDKQWLAASLPGWTRVGLVQALHQPRYLSDSGRLFFNSPLGLVPQDANAKEDTYEYEPSGIGGCAVASGCVGLLSGGISSQETAFLDASEEGSDVFFLTTAKLSGADADSAYDVYDAHICSSASPCPEEVTSTSPACTTSDSCRAAPPPQPEIFGPPASATFSGKGNVTPKAAQKGAQKAAFKPLTRAQKLARALKACRKRNSRHRRIICENRVRHAPKFSVSPAGEKKKK